MERGFGELQSLGRKASVRVCAVSSAKPVLMKPPPTRAAWHGCNTTLTFSMVRDSTWDSSMIFEPCCLKFLLSLFWLYQSLGLSWRQPIPLSLLLLISPMWSLPNGLLKALGKAAMSKILTCAGAGQGLHKPPPLASQSQYFCQPQSIQLTLGDAIFYPLTGLKQMIFWSGCL